MSTAVSLRPSGLPELNDEYVCWSRMQSEAGQGLDAIVARKEKERVAGNGIFLWGVGNAPALIAGVLARSQQPVRVVFSIMKSRPKAVDVSPAKIVAWHRYLDAEGVERELPAHALVTSRADGAAGPKRMHFALMCYSDEPLTLRTGLEDFDPSAYRNAGGTGAPVGNSQVTALLKRVRSDAGSTDYEVNISAWLAGSYWVRLTDPIEMSAQKRSLIGKLDQVPVGEWTKAVSLLRQGPSACSGQRIGSLL